MIRLGLIPLKIVSERTGLSGKEILERVQKRKFPRPIQRIITCYMWFEDEVHDWIVKELEKNLKGKN